MWLSSCRRRHRWMRRLSVTSLREGSGRWIQISRQQERPAPGKRRISSSTGSDVEVESSNRKKRRRSIAISSHSSAPPSSKEPKRHNAPAQAPLQAPVVAEKHDEAKAGAIFERHDSQCASSLHLEFDVNTVTAEDVVRMVLQSSTKPQQPWRTSWKNFLKLDANSGF